jgi:hypothetical protein
LRTAVDQSGKLPFSGAGGAAAAKQAAWQGAIANEMGESGANAFTPDVMDAAKTRIGNAFDTVARNTTIDQASTDTLANVDLPKIEADLDLVPMSDGQRSALKATMNNIIKTVNPSGEISGADYQALTRAKTPLDLAESSPDPNVAHMAGRIRDALDDAFISSASPADQAALVQAKYQYRVMRTVDQLAAGSRDGNITPEGFMQKVLTASRRFDAPTGGIAYTGGRNIGELARIGKLMRAAPQTGTADRLAINALALGGGSGLAYYAANPLAALGVPAALAANRAANVWMRSPQMVRNAISNALNPAPYAPGIIPGVASGYNALRQP